MYFSAALQQYGIDKQCLTTETRMDHSQKSRGYQAWSIKRLSTEIQRSALETNLTLDLNLRRGSSISLNQKEVRLSYMADNNKATLQIQCTTTKKISILQSQRLHIPKSDVDKSLLPFTNSSYCLSAVCK